MHMINSPLFDRRMNNKMNAKQLIRGHLVRYLFYFCVDIWQVWISQRKNVENASSFSVKGHNYIRGYPTHMRGGSLRSLNCVCVSVTQREIRRIRHDESIDIRGASQQSSPCGRGQHDEINMCWKGNFGIPTSKNKVDTL